MMTQNMKNLTTWNTIYNADSVEWCPIAPYRHVFVCGTYQLVENTNQEDDSDIVHEAKKQVKLGDLLLLALDNSVPVDTVKLLQKLEVPAVLDTKWSHHKINNRILLGVANAEGELVIYELNDLHCQLTLLVKTRIFSEERENILALSLDWSDGKYDDLHESVPLIAVSDSLGGVNLFKLIDTDLQQETCWKAHDHEAWIVAFDYWNKSIVYSGGDDCKLLVFDARINSNKPTVVNKIHEMGVTSIHCNGLKENMLISGSYDEILRIWDTRSMRRPVTTLPLTGGIWRLKWDPHQFHHILAACMHGGLCVINVENSDSPKIIAKYNKQRSLTYGCDWCYMSDTEIRNLLNERIQLDSCKDLSLFATCSFNNPEFSLLLIDKESFFNN